MGDGSVSVVLLTGALLEKAQELMKMEIHPATIVDGYNLAEQKVLELLRELAQDFDPEDKGSMVNLARSCMETVLSRDESAFMARLVVEGAEKVRERTHEGLTIDPDQVSIVKKTGGTVLDSELINGIALYREPTRNATPRDVHDARIALISETLKIRRTIFKAEITMDSPEQMKAFKEEERRLLMEKVQVILRTGANVIISKGTYDDYIQLALTKMGIMAIRRAQVPDIEKLARATGGRIVPEIETITSEDLGYAKHIHVRTLEQENWLFVEGCKAPKAVTLLIRGSSSSAVETAGIAVRTALFSLERETRDPAVFPGGGSLEAELAHRIRKWALSLHDRRQLVVLKYAEALESIPLTLAESCGRE
jgi:archaeal chaperonin